ncbi:MULTISPECIES: hypothetical protein [unclassified Haematospirillum]|uniref:hypothetical protein n=1 Tax=unclassified Haematospirillum TaxID=2622088 RepID=UPI00143B9BF2|nr:MULTISPECIES: hypothetical protein [unclassified Haematospirillum]NKD55381.1 hypothetical protein [Haematospirillum sp. H4890]NKD75491.1 hypothetical protein [Haematospirillum sp. H4485]
MPVSPQEKKALKFLFQHLLAGCAGALLCGIMILWLDIGNIRTLSFRSDHPVLYTGLLFFGLFVTFGSVSMGIGIMSLGEDRN